jgi:FHS family L-fucose permease-like MFS transporter
MSKHHRAKCSYRSTIIVLSALFFAWGFLTSLNDILVPHLKGMFQLSYAEAATVQAAFFLAYFCFSLPAGAIVGRVGYKNGVATGLGVAAVGAALFVPAAYVSWFPLFLLALFILAAGITLIQVAANPYVTLLGPSESSSSRLNLTQAFNSLGTTLAPAIGGFVILKPVLDHATVTAASSVSIPYLFIAALLAILAVSITLLPLVEPTGAAERASIAAIKEALSSRHLKLATAAIFLYVGAEVSIGSFLVSFISSTLTLTGGEQQAAYYVSFYWGAAMVGRFIGSALLQHINPARLLTAAAFGSIALITTSMLSQGHISVYAILAVGLCNSIMFPTIFSLGVRDLGQLTSTASSLIMMAVVGGAVATPMMGALADEIGLKWAFILPATFYLYIAYFGWRGSDAPASFSSN